MEEEIVDLCEENRKRCSPELNAMMRESDPSFNVADGMIRYYLRKRVCNRKPLLRPANKMKRLAWARRHRHKPLDFWRKVLWSDEDEKKIELFNSTCHQNCCRREGEPL